MMLFQRRLFLELCWNTLSTLFLLLAIILLATSARIVHKVETLTFATFIESLPIYAATAMHLVLPVAVLVGIVVTYGRASGDNEIDALRASGVHPGHLFTPGLVFGVLMSLLLLCMVDYAVPWAERQERRLSKSVDIGQLLVAKLSAAEPVALGGRHMISADRVDEGGMPRDIRLLEFDDERTLRSEIVADRGKILVDQGVRELTLVLLDWQWAKGGSGRGETWTISLPLPSELATMKLEHMTTPQLMAWLDRPEGQRTNYRASEVLSTIHMRLAMAVTCTLFVLLGLPIAVLSRRSDRMGSYIVAFSLALFVYYPSLKVSQALSESALIDPVLASWVGSALLGVIGLALSFRVLTR